RLTERSSAYSYHSGAKAFAARRNDALESGTPFRSTLCAPIDAEGSMRRPVLPCLLLFLLPLLTAAPSGQQAAATHGTATAPGTAARPAGSKIWIGREAEFEAFLATAPVERLEQIPVGVTKPMRAFVEPGGPATSFVFKPLTPSRAHGYWESYKAEIAAYELDK